jgi:hypothetical protein
MDATQDMRNIFANKNSSNQDLGKNTAAFVPSNEPFILVEEKFGFKTKKLKDATGKEVGEVKPHAPIKLTLPVPTHLGILSIIANRSKEGEKETGKKQYDLLIEAVQNIISSQARQLINTLKEAQEQKGQEVKISSEMVDPTKLTWEFIATMPPAERRGGGIAKEVWEDFIADYKAIMPAALGKKQEPIDAAADLFAKKFQSVKTNKPVIRALVDFLSVWVNKSPNAEEFMECYEFLVNKADTLLKADEAALLEMLQ